MAVAAGSPHFAPLPGQPSAFLVLESWVLVKHRLQLTTVVSLLQPLPEVVHLSDDVFFMDDIHISSGDGQP